MERLAVTVAVAIAMLTGACSSSSSSSTPADRAAASSAASTPIPAANIPCTADDFKAALADAPAKEGISGSEVTVNDVKCAAGWAYADLSTPEYDFEALFTYADDSMEPDHWVFVTSDEPLPVSEMVKEGVPEDVANQLCTRCSA